MHRLVLLCLAIAACAERPDRPGVLGTPADVSTPAGAYTGYRVMSPCTGPGSNVGVIGTGATKLTLIADIERAGGELDTQLRDIKSIWSWDYGLVCEPGVGVNIYLSDWHDVDTLIARSGLWLQAHDVMLQVAISVGSMPVADAQ